MTGDLAGKIWEHREGMLPDFTKTYGVKLLFYYEEFGDVGLAIHRGRG